MLTSLQQEILQCRLCPRLVEWRERVAREKVLRFRDQEYWGRPVPSFRKGDASLQSICRGPVCAGARVCCRGERAPPPPVCERRRPAGGAGEKGRGGVVHRRSQRGLALR